MTPVQLSPTEPWRLEFERHAAALDRAEADARSDEERAGRQKGAVVAELRRREEAVDAAAAASRELLDAASDLADAAGVPPPQPRAASRGVALDWEPAIAELRKAVTGLRDAQSALEATAVALLEEDARQLELAHQWRVAKQAEQRQRQELEHTRHQQRVERLMGQLRSSGHGAALRWAVKAAMALAASALSFYYFHRASPGATYTDFDPLMAEHAAFAAAFSVLVGATLVRVGARLLRPRVPRRGPEWDRLRSKVAQAARSEGDDAALLAGFVQAAPTTKATLQVIGASLWLNWLVWGSGARYTLPAMLLFGLVLPTLGLVVWAASRHVGDKS